MDTTDSHPQIVILDSEYSMATQSNNSASNTTNLDWNEFFSHLGETRHADTFGGEEIPNKITPLLPEETASALSLGYKKVVGKTPSAAILKLLLGQWAFETGNGKSIHNYNYGNKKATGNDDYQYFRCSEIVNGQTVFYDPPHPACRFAAYRTSTEGAEAFIRLLQKRPNWWNGLHTGTVSGFVSGLSAQPYAYFTDNPTIYAKGLEARAAMYADLAKKYGGSVLWQTVAGIGISAILYAGWYDLEQPNSRIRMTVNRLKNTINDGRLARMP